MKYNIKALFEYLEAKFKDIDCKFEDQSKNFSVLQSAVDKVVKDHKDFKIVLAVQKHRIDKLEKTVYET